MRGIYIKTLFHSLFISILLMFVAACSSSLSEQEMLVRAKTYMQKNQVREAAIELKNILQNNPDNGEARFLLGGLDLDIGDSASAIKEFKRAIDAGWDKQDSTVNLARAYNNALKFTQTLDDIDIDEQFSSEAKANLYALKAAALFSQGRITDADSLIKKGMELSPDALYLNITQIRKLLSVNDFKAAEKVIKSVSKNYPENREILLLEAITEDKLGNDERVRDIYLDIINRDPENYITAYGRRARLGLIRYYILRGDYAEGEKFVKSLLDFGFKDPETNYLAGYLAFVKKDYSLAEERLLQVLNVLPADARSQLLFGMVSFAQRDYEQAAYYMEKYLDTQPEDIQVRKLLGRTYILLGQNDQASKILEPSVSLNTDDAELLAMVGLSQIRAGNYEHGLTELERAVAAAPDKSAIRNELARAYLSTGATKDAIKELEKSLEISGKNLQTRALLALAYLRSGDRAKAIDAALDILNDWPDNPKVLVLVSSVLAATGDYDSAREKLNQALELKPGDELATISLARIDEIQGDLAAAQSRYESLVDSDGVTAIPFLQLARISEKEGDSQGMLAWLEKGRNKVPGDVRPHILLAEYYLRHGSINRAQLLMQEALKIAPEDIDVRTLDAKLMLANKQYNKAVGVLNDLVSQAADPTYIRTLLAENYLALKQYPEALAEVEKVLDKESYYVPAILLASRIEAALNHYDKALEYALRVQQSKPDSIAGFAAEGDIWMDKKDYMQAATAYKKAWQKKHTADLALRYGQALRLADMPDQAERVLGMMVEEQPGNVHLHELYGTVLQQNRRNNQAISQFEAVLVVQPDNAVALNNLAWLYGLNGEKKALAYAEKVYQLKPEDPGVMDTYGWILLQQGKINKGTELLAKAYTKLPQVPEVAYHYAAGLIRSGETAKGRDLLKSVLKKHQYFIGREDALQLLENS